MDENHEKFKQHLKDSDEAIWFVARWLVGQGQTISIRPHKVAPTHSEWREYADNGDLHILKDEQSWERTEVKHLGVCFTCRDDWPFPDFIVCAKHSFDLADQKPRYYFIVSNDWKALAIVSTTKFDHWTQTERTDHRYENVKQTFYLCPLEDVAWRKIND